MPPARRAPVVLKARVGRRDAKERNVAAIPKEEQEKEEKNITENEEIGRLLWGEDSRRRSGGESLVSRTLEATLRRSKVGSSVLSSFL